MGKFSTGEKRKFDLITASKTKKYKIITAVILVLGILMLGGGLIMSNLESKTVIPNSLEIDNLSGLDRGNNHCIISQDETFTISTGTLSGHPLSTPIRFKLLNGAEDFLSIIPQSYYDGLFTIYVKEDAPKFVENPITHEFDQHPTGTLRITCGSELIQIEFEYVKP